MLLVMLVEDECQIRHYEKHAPGLLHVLKENYWHRAIGTKQKSNSHSNSNESL
jgi:hypothetical protein